MTLFKILKQIKFMGFVFKVGFIIWVILFVVGYALGKNK